MRETLAVVSNMEDGIESFLMRRWVVTGGVYTNIESFLLRRVVVSSGVYTMGGIHGLDFDVISLVSDA